MKRCSKNEFCKWIANTVYPDIRNKKNELINDINLNLNDSKSLLDNFIFDGGIPGDHLAKKLSEAVEELKDDMNTITNNLNTYSSNLDNEISSAISNHQSHYHNYLESLKKNKDDEIKETALE